MFCLPTPDLFVGVFAKKHTVALCAEKGIVARGAVKFKPRELQPFVVRFLSLHLLIYLLGLLRAPGGKHLVANGQSVAEFVRIFLAEGFKTGEGLLLLVQRLIKLELLIGHRRDNPFERFYAVQGADGGLGLSRSAIQLHQAGQHLAPRRFKAREVFQWR